MYRNRVGAAVQRSRLSGGFFLDALCFFLFLLFNFFNFFNLFNLFLLFDHFLLFKLFLLLPLVEMLIMIRGLWGGVRAAEVSWIGGGLGRVGCECG